MRIVITGVSSFIGMHLASWMQKCGTQVVGSHTKPLDRYDEMQAKRLKKLSKQGVVLKKMDLLERPSVEALITEYVPDVWIQHAGWAEKYGSMEYDLSKAYAVNVAPLEPLYASLKDNGCKGMILTGSSMEYSDTSKACEENDVCWPDTPYGLSKLTATLRARQLAYQYRLPTRVARVFIPFGDCDAPKKLLPATVESLSVGKGINLSPCEQKRDFIWIGDLVKGYQALIHDLKRDTLFDIFNLCSGEATSLKKLLLDLSELMGASSGLLRFGAIAMRPGEPAISYGDNVKAMKILNWFPDDLTIGLQSYLESMKK